MMRIQKCSLLQRAMAMLLSAVLVIGMVASAVPMQVFAQENVAEKDETENTLIGEGDPTGTPDEDVPEAPAENSDKDVPEAPAENPGGDVPENPAGNPDENLPGGGADGYARYL